MSSVLNFSSNVEISLYHVFRLRNEINNSLTSIKEIKKQITNHTVWIKFGEGAICSYCLIKAVAFYEEWNKYLIHEMKADHEDFLEKVKNFIFNLDEEYPEVKKLRHNMLAHPFRDSTERYSSVFSLGKDYTSFKAPDSIIDVIIYLIKLTFLMSEILENFPSIYKKFVQENSFSIDDNQNVIL